MPSLLGIRIPVLDDGFVQLVDTMGDDNAIVQAARKSYGEGTKTPKKDRNLIRLMMRNKHTSPFEMCEIKLLVRVPMDCWRQWIRHRTANVNEFSTRYAEAIDSCQGTDPGEWRVQSRLNKQGSMGFLPREVGERLCAEETLLQGHARTVYEKRLELGVAREQARKDLTLSTYTEAVWKIDLHNLFHFLQLRLGLDAQHEIRQYAQAIAHIVREWVPVAWEAFEDYRLNAVTFSRVEIELLRHIVYDSAGASKPVLSTDHSMTKREFNEFKAKLASLWIRQWPMIKEPTSEAKEEG